jgi:type II secretory pathway pseudopilin PulG
MEQAETILVIITSSLLALLLILGIVLAIFIIKLVRSIRRVADKAEDLIDSAESVTEAFKNASGPLAVLKTVQNIVSMVNDHKGKGRKK